MLSERRRVLIILGIILFAVGMLVWLLPGIPRAIRFKDGYVFVTIEESSTQALLRWPLLTEATTEVFVDGNSSALLMRRKPNMLGVCLGVYYAAFSQGVELHERMLFSRSGRVTLHSEQPISLKTSDLYGRTVEAVDNGARILRGPVTIEKTFPDGTVAINYGGRTFRLGPGESWAELLVRTDEGIKEIGSDNWASEFGEALRQGYPATRFAITNRGIWPKANIKAGVGT